MAIVAVFVVALAGGAVAKQVMDSGRGETEEVQTETLASSATTPAASASTTAASTTATAPAASATTTAVSATATRRSGSVTTRAGSTATRGGSATATDDLAVAARTKVFFGHQSVGGNVIEAIPRVYADHGASAPQIVNGRGPAGAQGYFSHASVGQNGMPQSKIADFDAQLRSGIGSQVDVAFMKFCYVDVLATTDVDALFATYRSTMAALERDFPDVAFVHVTVPLTTADQADNAARERLNNLIRRQYGSARLFDIAAVESTAPGGGRVSGTYRGQRYYALYDGYAADSGHLNATGAAAAASALLAVIARAARS